MIPKVTIVVGQKKLSAVNLNLPVTADSENQVQQPNEFNNFSEKSFCR